MNNIQILENKYIDLLLNRCLNFDKSKSLFVSYVKGADDFINKLVKKAKEKGINDIYLECNDPYKKHELLKDISIDDISNHPSFNKKVWNDYALKNASFLILETEIPGLMDDIEPDKIAKVRYVERLSMAIYKEKQLSFQIPWCICAFPNEKWANMLFPNLEDAYEKLFVLICKMCMVDTENPIESWNEFLKETDERIKKLNNLEIKKLNYKNSLGTDLTIWLSDNIIWSSAGSLGENMLVNMPSYEVFTNPNFHKTEGIVYSSRPLSYGGGIIDKFFLEFKDGKVINYGAEKGKNILKGIIESDQYSSYLGEVALINNDSPISNTGLVFSNTLFDENASCHLALGNGFAECIKNNEQMSEEELFNMGVNPSKNHVDFMIGTPDLEIIADTKDGEICIFKNGNFNI